MDEENRRYQRRQVAQPALILGGDDSIVGDCMMLDVSAGGARLKFKKELALPNEFVLLLSKFNSGMRRRCFVAWKGRKEVGVRFLPD